MRADLIWRSDFAYPSLSVRTGDSPQYDGPRRALSRRKRRNAAHPSHGPCDCSAIGYAIRYANCRCRRAHRHLQDPTSLARLHAQRSASIQPHLRTATKKRARTAPLHAMDVVRLRSIDDCRTEHDQHSQRPPRWIVRGRLERVCADVEAQGCAETSVTGKCERSENGRCKPICSTQQAQPNTRPPLEREQTPTQQTTHPPQY